MRAGSPFRRERRSHRPWRGADPPRRVLIIRLHAIGDVALVLPAASRVARAWPGARLDMLTAPTGREIAGSLTAFRNVLLLDVSGSPLRRIVGALRQGICLRKARYDVIIDFQRNYLTRIIRWVSGPTAWSEFDRFSPHSAAERTLSTLASCGVPHPAHDIPFPQSPGAIAAAAGRLAEAGWDGSTRLAVFNPAGLWATRNWPMENYVELLRLWRSREPVQVLILGTERVRERGEEIARRSGGGVINLAGETSGGEAFALLRHAHVIVTEDSGLMHMAWGAGVPVVALFGSTNSTWASPPAAHAVSLDSRDMPCGCCMEPSCVLGDVRCLARRTPGEVLRAATALLMRCEPLSPGENG